MNLNVQSNLRIWLDFWSTADTVLLCFARIEFNLWWRYYANLWTETNAIIHKIQLSVWCIFTSANYKKTREHQFFLRDPTNSETTDWWKSSDSTNKIVKTKTRKKSYKTVSAFKKDYTLSSKVAFHIETSHLFWSTKQMTGFYMKRNTGMKRVNLL